jgi:hypothetical protein
MIQRLAFLQRGEIGVAVEADHHVGAGEVDAQHMLDMGGGRFLIVEADDHRLQAPRHHLAARFQRVAQVVEEHGAQQARLRQIVHLHGGLGDDAEHTLGAEEEPRPVRAGRVEGHRRGADDLARGQHDLHAEHHVFGLAILGADRPGAARREIAAQRGAVGRRGIVGQRQPAFVERPFELRAVDARLRRHRERLLVDLDDLVQPLGVHDDAAEDRRGAALRAGAAAPGHHGNLVLVGDVHDRGDFFAEAGCTMKSGVGSGWPRSSHICGIHDQSVE